MTEGELRLIAEDPKSLTDDAIGALRAELTRRNIEIDLSVPTPEPESHPDIPNLVILRHFRDLPEALLAKGGLESAGIECFFDDDNIVRMDWFISNAVGGIKLLVRPEDVAAANEILKTGIPPAFDVPGVGEYSQPKCPKCASLDVVSEDVNELLRDPFGSSDTTPANEKDWKCESCGYAWHANADEKKQP
jgi:hypothetical protein